MKENPIPTRDLKTGAKVVGIVGQSVFESVKPYLKREAQKRVIKILRILDGRS